VAVVTYGMGTYELFVARLVGLAIAGDVVVVARVSKAVNVVADELHHAVALVAACGAAVNDDQINSPHSSSLLVFLEESHAAALHADGAGNGGEDGGYDSQNLFPCR
jgi:hypothetical protein